MRRALTMVEMLIALGLLSVLAAALLSWTQATLRGGTEALRATRWRSAAEAVLDLIHDDLVTGEKTTSQQQKLEDKLTLEDGRLSIHCRGEMGGPTQHRYELDRSAGDPQDGKLQLSVIDDRSQERARRTLLAVVNEFELALDEDTRALTVSIRSSDGLAARRMYLVP